MGIGKIIRDTVLSIGVLSAVAGTTLPVSANDNLAGKVWGNLKNSESISTTIKDGEYGFKIEAKRRGPFLILSRYPIGAYMFGFSEKDLSGIACERFYDRNHNGPDGFDYAEIPIKFPSGTDVYGNAPTGTLLELGEMPKELIINYTAGLKAIDSKMQKQKKSKSNSKP